MFEYIRLSKKREREKERERFGLISSEERKKSKVSRKKKIYFARLFLFFSPVSFFTERLKLIYCYLSLKNTFVFSTAKLVVAKEV